jgi:preprotein translocase YajC subunit
VNPLFSSVVFAAAKKTTSSSATTLIFVVVIIGALYFLFLRPRQKRSRVQREQTSTVDVGDEILTVGGIIGRVVEVHENRLVIVTGGDSRGDPATGEPTRLVLLRTGVSRRLQPSAPENEHESTDDSDDGSEHESS